MALTRINEVSIRKKFVEATGKEKFVGFMRNAANTRFVIGKEIVLETFDNHPVTQELLQDPNKEGSKFVDHGNLVSFIGFEDGGLEVGKLREFLREEIKMSPKPKDISIKGNKINYSFSVKYPSKAQIEENFSTPDNWHNKSWIYLIENGISNAASYIFSRVGFSFGGSRSDFGLQLKDKNGNPRERKSGGTFRPVKYITEILDNFVKRFK